MRLSSRRQEQGILARYLDPADLRREFARVAGFHRELGIRGIGPDWFHHVGRAAWHQRHPGIYRVFERGSEIAGFMGVAPLHPECAEELLAGRRSLWWDVGPDGILSPEAHARARLFGCVLLLDAYLRADAEVDRQMRWDLTRELRGTHLRLLLAHSSDETSEAGCEAIGMRRMREGPLLPGGRHRWLWCASLEDLDPPEPLVTAPQPYLWYVFDQIRSQFSPSHHGLRLTPREQQVAYLHYYEGYAAPAIAGILGCKRETVRTHMKHVREKAARVLPAPPGEEEIAGERGVLRRSIAIAAYLREHPGDLQEAGALFGAGSG